MPYEEGEEIGRKNREWVFAEYQTDPLGNRTKIPNTGVQVDRRSRAVIPCRTRNRPDQRYELPLDEIRNRRTARALAEVGESLAIRASQGRIEVVSVSENRYDCNGEDQPLHCACPDFERLTLSYPGEPLMCKHILIARLKEAERFPNPLDVGVLWLAETIGVHYSTIQNACKEGRLPARKEKRTWVLYWKDAEEFVVRYRANMYDPDFMAWFKGVLPILVAERPKK